MNAEFAPKLTPDPYQRLASAIAQIERAGWEVVWRRKDDVLLRKHVLPPGYTVNAWERFLRKVGLARRDYQRWWVAADGELRATRSDRQGHVLSETRRPL